MSSTRTAEPGSKPRQERFMSSAEFEIGLMANLVSRRCSVLKSAKERELIYWVQSRSHEKGGLEKLSKDLIEKFRDKIATRTMLKVGCHGKKLYSLAEAKEIRADVPFDVYGFYLEDFFADENAGAALLNACTAHTRPLRQSPPKIQSFPTKVLKDECESFAEKELASFLEELCLNPEKKLNAGPWYFPALIESLFDYQAELSAQESQAIVQTELAKIVHDALDYSLHSRGLVLIDGLARTGKSTAAKNWVQTHIGKARFAEVPPGDSDILFFRAIAKALGLSSNLNQKAHELRERIESVLRTGDLLLCLDESQFCFVQSNYRDALPFRVSWVLSMVNAGVPIVLIVTEQFLHALKRNERRSGWQSSQLKGRIADYRKLPDALSDSDLSAVAKIFLPDGDADSIRLLLLNAKASEKYLAGIEFAVLKARYLASKAGREKVLIGDLKRAIAEGVIPSDKLLAQALAKPERPTAGRGRRTFLAAPELVAHAPRNSKPISETEIPQRNLQPIESHA